MFIGGFYEIDMDLLKEIPEEERFELRCDRDGQYRNMAFTNVGRTATTLAVRDGLHLGERDVILVPDYLCVSVLNALEVSHAKFRFYRIRKDLTVDMDDLERKMDRDVKVVYVIHYFGIPQPASVKSRIGELQKSYDFQVVEDLTQALYTVHPDRIGFGAYLVASTRKWTPVTDGGLMAVRNDVPFSMPLMPDGYDEAAYRQLFITIAREYYSQHSNANVSDYLRLEQEANAARYKDFTPKKMTELSRRIFFNFDHAAAIDVRRKNYAFLMDQLRGLPGIEMLASPLDEAGAFVPFGFPVLVENRDACYRYLAEHGIIGEIQWRLPVDYYTPGRDAQYLSDHNIMLQCDQRYSEEQMQRTADCIKQYFGG